MEENKEQVEIQPEAPEETTQENDCNNMQEKLMNAIVNMASLEEIKTLLDSGAQVNELVDEYNRPIHCAVSARYLEAARLLLDMGCDVNARGDFAMSPLDLAVENGKIDMVKLLLEYGAKVNSNPGYLQSLGYKMPDEPLRRAMEEKRYDIARLLLEHGANQNKTLYYEAEISRVLDPEGLELLLTFGADPDSRDENGLTPLMKAIRLKRIEAVLVLIKFGADVNAVSGAKSDFRTAMHYAILSGCVELVNLLINKGAKMNYERPDIKQPIPLHFAVLKGDANLVQILLDSGAQVNWSKSLLGSPLQVACSKYISDQKEIIKILLENGADPNLKIYSDDNRIQLQPALAEYLAGNTEPDFEIIMMLIQYGARVVIKNQFRDPVGILNHIENIVSEEHQQIFDLLLEAAESFDLFMIKRTRSIPAKQKEALIQRAKTPIPLKAQSRIFLRRYFNIRLLNVVTELNLPKILSEYLIFNCS